MAGSRLEHLRRLGLENDASDEDIRVRFKSLALKTHPDKNPDDPQATEKFQQLNESYMFLTKDEDEDEEEWFDNNNDEDDVDLFDILSFFFDMRYGGGFGGGGGMFFFGGLGGGPRRARGHSGRSYASYRQDSRSRNSCACDDPHCHGTNFDSYVSSKNSFTAQRGREKQSYSGMEGFREERYPQAKKETGGYSAAESVAQQAREKKNKEKKKKREDQASQPKTTNSQPQTFSTQTSEKKLSKKEQKAEAKRKEKEMADIARDLEIKRLKEEEKEKKRKAKEEEKKKAEEERRKEEEKTRIAEMEKEREEKSKARELTAKHTHVIFDEKPKSKKQRRREAKLEQKKLKETHCLSGTTIELDMPSSRAPVYDDDDWEESDSTAAFTQNDTNSWAEETPSSGFGSTGFGNSNGFGASSNGFGNSASGFGSNNSAGFGNSGARPKKNLPPRMQKQQEQQNAWGGHASQPKGYVKHHHAKRETTPPIQHEWFPKPSFNMPEAPAPQENIWDRRTENQAAFPSTANEEDEMLRVALEMSRLEAEKEAIERQMEADYLRELEEKMKPPPMPEPKPEPVRSYMKMPEPKFADTKPQWGTELGPTLADIWNSGEKAHAQPPISKPAPKPEVNDWGSHPTKTRVTDIPVNNVAMTKPNPTDKLCNSAEKFLKGLPQVVCNNNSPPRKHMPSIHSSESWDPASSSVNSASKSVVEKSRDVFTPSPTDYTWMAPIISKVEREEAAKSHEQPRFPGNPTDANLIPNQEVNNNEKSKPSVPPTLDEKPAEVTDYAWMAPIISKVEREEAQKPPQPRRKTKRANADMVDMPPHHGDSDQSWSDCDLDEPKVPPPKNSVSLGDSMTRSSLKKPSIPKPAPVIKSAEASDPGIEFGDFSDDIKAPVKADPPAPIKMNGVKLALGKDGKPRLTAGRGRRRVSPVAVPGVPTAVPSKPSKPVEIERPVITEQPQPSAPSSFDAAATSPPEKPVMNGVHDAAETMPFSGGRGRGRRANRTGNTPTVDMRKPQTSSASEMRKPQVLEVTPTKPENTSATADPPMELEKPADPASPVKENSQFPAMSTTAGMYPYMGMPAQGAPMPGYPNVGQMQAPAMQQSQSQQAFMQYMMYLNQVQQAQGQIPTMQGQMPTIPSQMMAAPQPVPAPVMQMPAFIPVPTTSIPGAGDANSRPQTPVNPMDMFMQYMSSGANNVPTMQQPAAPPQMMQAPMGMMPPPQVSQPLPPGMMAMPQCHPAQPDPTNRAAQPSIIEQQLARMRLRQNANS